jgi:hypothetical protein
MTARDFRRIALRFPLTAEAAHMGHPDFGVAGRIFATLGHPGPGWGAVMLTPDQQQLFIRAQPTAFKPANGAWGRAGSTVVRLQVARTTAVHEALLLAWRNRAPKRVAAQFSEP